MTYTKMIKFLTVAILLSACSVSESGTTEDREYQCDPCQPNFAAYACQAPNECVDYLCPATTTTKEYVIGFCTLADPVKAPTPVGDIGE